MTISTSAMAICTVTIYTLTTIERLKLVNHSSESNPFDFSANASTGDVGKSMVQAWKTKDVSHDVEAVYCIAIKLLDLWSSPDKKSMSWKMAEAFIRMPADTDLRSLLKVSTDVGT
jgi:hypothetical protein